MKENSYHKPIISSADKTQSAKSILLAGVRAMPIMILKSELLKAKNDWLRFADLILEL